MPFEPVIGMYLQARSSPRRRQFLRFRRRLGFAHWSYRAEADDLVTPARVHTAWLTVVVRARRPASHSVLNSATTYRQHLLGSRPR